MIEALHPSLILVATAAIILLLPHRLRQIFLVAGPLLAVAAVAHMSPGTLVAGEVLGYKLVFLKADALSLVFGLIFSIMSLLGGVYALHVTRRGEHMAALLYAAGSLGVVFAGDWITLFFFWELMSISSVFLIWYRNTARSLKAGFRYLLVHFFGGNLLLLGVLLLVGSGNPAVGTLTGTGHPAFWPVLLGVAVNAAIPPLHAWLTDAYPEGTVTGSVYLSAFTTKVAVYVLVRVFPGAPVLLWAGTIMALYGVIYAAMENNIRRLLAYHIISQVGYMVAAVGIGTEMGLNGSVAHAYSHILYKSLLFMGTGAVIYATGREWMTELGGIARFMPFTALFYTVGALSISGAPLFNGFISKSVVISAAAKSGLPAVDFLLTLASVGTFLSIGLKLLYFTFFGEDQGIKPRPLPFNMHLAMAMNSLLCLLYGIFPGLLYSRLPYPLEYEPYTVDHIMSSVQLLAATAAAFWLLLPRLDRKIVISLDTDWVYRKPLAVLLYLVVGAITGLREALYRCLSSAYVKVTPYFANPYLFMSFLRSGPGEGAGNGEGAAYDPGRYGQPLGVNVSLAAVVIVAVTVFLLWRSTTP